jgi:hypothetical protein
MDFPITELIDGDGCARLVARPPPPGWPAPDAPNHFD